MTTTTEGACEGLLQRVDEPDLFWRWRPAREPRSVVTLVHGISEHSGRYEHVFAALAARGHSCLAIDLRGFGRSGGSRAFVERFDDYLDDAAAGLELAGERAQNLPRFLLGHSMGGLIAARFIEQRASDVAARGGLRGVVLSSPGLAILGRVPRWKHLLGVVLSHLAPRFSLPTDIAPETLSHDEQMLLPMARDPLLIPRISARLYTELVAAQAAVLQQAPDIGCPLLLLVAEDDLVVDVEGTRRFEAAAPVASTTAHYYPGFYHEVFNELERERVFDDLCTWLEGQL